MTERARPRRIALAAAAAALLATPALGQDRPDLSGTWDNGGGIGFLRPQDLGEGNICVTGCPPPAAEDAAAPRPTAAPPTRPAYREEFAGKVVDLTERQVEEDPVLRCLPPGLPRLGPPDKIVQGADEFAFLYEDVSGPFFRVVPVGPPDAQHRSDVDPAYHGTSIGWWEGETLVVETVNFTDDTWLTDNGAFHTEDLRVVERLSLTEDGHLQWEATAHDPAVLAEPWALAPRIAPAAAWEIVESPPCIDRSLDHMVDGSYHANPR